MANPNLFDYFVNRNQQLLQAQPLAYAAPRSSLTPPAAAPAPATQPRDIGALVAQSNLPQEQSRPILGSDPYARDPATGRTIHTMDNNGNPLGGLQPPSTAPANEGTPPPVDNTYYNDPLHAAQEKVNWLDPQNAKNPVINKDHGFMGRLKDVLQQAVVSAGQQWNASGGRDMYGRGMDPWQRLAGSIGGGIAGGVAGGIDPTMDEKRQRLYDYGMARQKVGDIQNQQDRQLDMQSTQAKINKMNADAGAEESDNRLKPPLVDTVVPDKDPQTGQPLTNPDGTPKMRTIQVPSTMVADQNDRDKQRQNALTIEREQSAAGIQRQQQQIAATAQQNDLNRQLTTQEKNQASQLQADTTNSRNRFEWQIKENDRIKDTTTALSQSDAEIINANGALDRMSVARTNLENVLNDLGNTPEPAADATPTERTAYTAKKKAVDEAYKPFATAQKDVYSAASKARLASGVVSALKPLPAPAAVKPVIITTPKAPNKKAAANDPLKLF